MEDNGLNAYLNQMNQVSFRMSMIHNFLTQKPPHANEVAFIEVEVLQIRKIIEHIALGSLIANKEVYRRFHSAFEKCSNPRYIFRDLIRLNPHFYPKPIKLDTSVTPNNCIPVSENFMEKDEAITVYQKCSSMLHAVNPYGSQPDICYFRDNIPKWHQRLLVLTDNHLMHMVGREQCYLVIMRSAKTGRPEVKLYKRKGL